MKINEPYQLTSLGDVFRAFDPTLPAVAIDFETFYHTADGYSVSDMSYHAYCADPRFNAFMVAIHCRDFSYVGPVQDFDWERLRDYPIWLAHNSPFDRSVFKRCVELGQISAGINPLVWCNTIDVCAYKRVPRGLAKAMKVLYNVKRSKAVRSDMDGKVYDDLDEEEKASWLKYADGDAVDCYRIWEDHKLEMPMLEHLASIHTSETVERGVHINRESVEKQYEALKYAVNRAENLIPWNGEQELTAKGNPRFSKGKPKLAAPTSTIHMAKYFRSQGVKAPSSTDVKSAAFQDWADQIKDTKPQVLEVVKAIQTWRKCNMLVTKFEHILKYMRPDGRMEFQLKYFGGHTGRWSGTNSSKELDAEDEKGINMQNLLKKKFYLDADYNITPDEDEAVIVIDIRGVFGAQPGKKLTIADAAQIEPRCFGWVTDDDEFLELCRNGVSPYVIHAVQTMGYKGDPKKMKVEAPKIYALAKARELALGYQAGWARFIEMASLYIDRETFYEIFTADVSDEQIERFRVYCKKWAKETFAVWDSIDEQQMKINVNSWLIVTDFRKSNPKKKGLWDELDSLLRKSARRGETFTMKLPSGRSLYYFNITRKTLEAENVRGGARSKFYGGKLTENLIQAIARDVFTNTIIELELAGFPVIWHVHDEAIAETEEEPDLELFNKAFTTTPDWIPGLPIEAEIEVTDCYKK